jgi:hypothetical protein
MDSKWTRDRASVNPRPSGGFVSGGIPRDYLRHISLSKSLAGLGEGVKRGNERGQEGAGPARSLTAYPGAAPGDYGARLRPARRPAALRAEALRFPAGGGWAPAGRSPTIAYCLTPAFGQST